jgi:two-component system cell cycle sensor histidine kinase/response regulator CckA
MILAPVLAQSLMPAQKDLPVEGKETILVVDDQMIVLSATAMMLKRFGYTTLAADSGERAIELWESHSRKVDLLFTDVFMPGMNGAELATKLRTQVPDLKVLFTSGFGRDAVQSVLSPEQRTTFIEKPYSPSELATTIRSLLDPPQPAA